MVRRSISSYPTIYPCTVLHTAENDGVIYCFGRTQQEHNGGFIGCLIVAKREPVTIDTYEAGVWHELFPYASIYFGFEKG